MEIDKKTKEQKSKNTRAPSRVIFLFCFFFLFVNFQCLRENFLSMEKTATIENLPGMYTGFVFPKMLPDEIDRFISWCIRAGYDHNKLHSATDQMKRTIYNQYAKRYNKKRV